MTHLDEIVDQYLFDNDTNWMFIHEKIKARFLISPEQKGYYEQRKKNLRTSLASLLEKYGEEIIKSIEQKKFNPLAEIDGTRGIQLEERRWSMEVQRTKLKDIIKEVRG